MLLNHFIFNSNTLIIYKNCKGINNIAILSKRGQQIKEYFVVITKTCLYHFDPLKPHFYIVKLGFAGVYIIFLISAQNMDCGYSLEPPRRGGSNEYPQSMFRSEI